MNSEENSSVGAQNQTSEESVENVEKESAENSSQDFGVLQSERTSKEVVEQAKNGFGNEI